MKTYSITYDLGKPGQDYTNLISRIKSLGTTWARPTKSHWFVNTDFDVAQLRDILKPYLDKNDRLMVNEVGAMWATAGMPAEVNDWLHKNWQSANARV
jgi:hypothetical protein